MKKTFLITLFALCSFTAAQSQGNIHYQSDKYEWPTDENVLQKLRNWQDLKFGILLHWGIYSVPGIVESWSICDEDWITRDTTMTYQQYKDWYWAFSEKLNPTKFNPEQWATAAQNAGMKYMIFTTKHHDGFCMYDSRQTDFTIAQHAFRDNPKRDVLKYVLEAFREKQFMIGEYFSKPDWHSQYYWWNVHATRGRNVNYNVKKFPWRWNQFKKFTYNQIEEITSNYGKVDILWLDGGWVCTENNQDIDMPRIANMARKHQPGLIIVDRTIRGPYENYQTPEKTIPDVQLNYPWESCIPLSDDWGYVPKPHWKSAQKVINTLIEIVAKGGNLVLGVGPTPEGIIETAAVERMNEIGKWLKKYGKAIYNTTCAQHYNDGNLWFTASKDGKTLYALYALPEGEALPATISWQCRDNINLKSVRLLSTNKRMKATISSPSSLLSPLSSTKITITIPQNLPQEPIAFEMKLK